MSGLDVLDRPVMSFTETINDIESYHRACKLGGAKGRIRALRSELEDAEEDAEQTLADHNAAIRLARDLREALVEIAPNHPLANRENCKARLLQYRREEMAG